MTFILEMLARFAVSAVILLGASSSIAAERPAPSVRSVSVNLTEMPKPGRRLTTTPFDRQLAVVYPNYELQPTLVPWWGATGLSDSYDGELGLK